ncbi:MAG: calmodulin-binding protein [bacterium]|nr:calmodulin-binding protein [bacterium]
MMRRALLSIVLAVVVGLSFASTSASAADQAYGRVWGGAQNTRDWERFYHYPYVYYPQNFWGNEYYRSAESLYYRYPSEMRVPVYNDRWQNYYPEGRRYHSGHQFLLDVF